MAECSSCGGVTCPHCNKAVTTCVTHCYCQNVCIGSTAHKVCCKCGDRTASFAYHPAPYYPNLYPQWYYTNTWGAHVTSTPMPRASGNAYTLASNAGTTDATITLKPGASIGVDLSALS